MPNWSALETLPQVVPRKITPRGKPIFRLKIAGTDHEIGLRRGEELSEDLHAFWVWMQHLIEKVAEVPMDRWDEFASRLEKNLARNTPWMLEQIHGMAQGSGLPVRDLILCNFYGLVGECAGNWCTSVAVRRSDEGPLLAQNLDIGPEDFYYAEETHPTGGRATLGHAMLSMCRAECGVNDAGLAVGSSNLAAPAQGKIPWSWDGIYFHFLPTLVLRHCRNVAEAVEYLRSLPPTIPSGGGYQLNLIDATGEVAVVDKTGEHTIVRQCDPDLNFTSNCTLDDAFEKWRMGGPAADGRARARRIREEYRKLNSTPPSQKWLQDLMSSDKDEGCLCRWSNVGYSRLGFIFSPTKRTMDISNGPPNRTAYEHFEL